MESTVKACIVTACTPGFAHGVPVQGSPYQRGQDRLVNSLIHHGFSYDILAFPDWPNNEYGRVPYNIKASAIHEAMKRGYTRILWLDSSVWAVQNPNKIFEVINTEGWYFWRSGFNCAQVSNDAALKYHGISRNEAEGIHDCSSSMLGLHLDNPKAQGFAKAWLKSAKDGLWATSREHAGGSQDRRYQFDRQDQTHASLLIRKFGMTLHDPGAYSQYANDKGIYPDSVIFVMRGI